MRRKKEARWFTEQCEYEKTMGKGSTVIYILKEGYPTPSYVKDAGSEFPPGLVQAEESDTNENRKRLIRKRVPSINDMIDNGVIIIVIHVKKERQQVATKDTSAVDAKVSDVDDGNVNHVLKDNAIKIGLELFEKFEDLSPAHYFSPNEYRTFDACQAHRTGSNTRQSSIKKVSKNGLAWSRFHDFVAEVKKETVAELVVPASEDVDRIEDVGRSSCCRMC